MHSTSPAFKLTTLHKSLAQDAIAPDEKWQRPVSGARVDIIKTTFDTPGQFMPNPVLLAANPSTDIESKVRAEPLGMNEGLERVRVHLSSTETDKDRALWILDGQHRIAGLAKSNSQANNPVPFVLLMDDDDESFIPSTFAQIFAQVTTSAKPLEPLHEAWLSRAFHLNDYANQGAGNDGDRRVAAMDVSVYLCSKQRFGQVNNNFCFGKVQFNPFSSASGENLYNSSKGSVKKPSFHDPFAFSASEWTELIFSEFYKKTSEPLEPLRVAEQVAAAIAALAKQVSMKKESAFFGKSEAGGPGQQYMQKAFIGGVLATLLKLEGEGRPYDQNWQELLKSLNFDKTDWALSKWTESFQGTSGSASKKASLAVLKKYMVAGELPSEAEDLVDVLKGVGEDFQASMAEQDSNGHRMLHSALPHDIDTESRIATIKLGRRPNIRLVIPASVGKVVIRHVTGPPDAQTSLAASRAHDLKSLRLAPPDRKHILLQVEVYRYGTQRTTQLKFTL